MIGEPVYGTGPQFWIEYFRRKRQPRKRWWQFWR